MGVRSRYFDVGYRSNRLLERLEYDGSSECCRYDIHTSGGSFDAAHRPTDE